MGEHAPLVVAEVVEYHEKHLLTVVEQGEHLLFEHLWRHHRPLRILFVGTQVGHPVHIMFLDELRKAVVRILLLHLQHLRHVTVSGTQFQFPVYKSLIHIRPVLPRLTVEDLHGDLLEVLLILTLRHLRLDLPAVDVLLQCQQDLVGVHGLDQVVGNLLADGLFHDVLLLTLRHHDHREGRLQFLDAAQRLQSVQSRHLFVEQHQVEVMLFAQVDGIAAVGDGHHLIALLLQEKQVRLQQFDLIIYPK